MRIRTIKPDFWAHPVMGKQSDVAKLLAIGLLNLADDEGYFFADAKLIRNAIRPFDDDSGITTVALRELSGIGYISIRNHPTHGDIGKVESFAAHQVINKPKDSIIKGLYDYGSDTVAIPDSYRLEGKGKEQGKERKGPPPAHPDFETATPKLIDRIIAAYPVNGNKIEARRSLAGLNLSTPELETVLEKLTAIGGKIQKLPADQRRFLPGPSRFFEERRWNDDLGMAPWTYIPDPAAKQKSQAATAAKYAF